MPKFIISTTLGRQNYFHFYIMREKKKQKYTEVTRGKKKMRNIQYICCNYLEFIYEKKKKM